MPMTKVTVKLGLPWGIGEVGGEWVPDQAEREAAWELYIELITRISVAPLGPGDGLLREALASLYSLFATAREILRRYGPSVAQPRDGSGVSFGHLAVAVLNGALRPFLTRWHPVLEDHELARPSSLSRTEWERDWDRYGECRAELEQVNVVLTTFAGILGEVCEAKTLLALASYQPSLPPRPAATA
jgi:hypothetical protein